MSAVGRYCCKSLKRRSGQFLAKERNERESPINTASNPLRESPVSLARGDLSPHIIIQSPRLRGGEFESHLQKRLLQQYRPIAEILESQCNVSGRLTRYLLRRSTVTVSALTPISEATAHPHRHQRQSNTLAVPGL